jgi:hypothetical protein
MAEAALESISDKTGRGSGAGRWNEKVQIAGTEIIEELFLGDPGLERNQTQFRINVQEPIHSRKVQSDASTAVPEARTRNPSCDLC